MSQECCGSQGHDHGAPQPQGSWWSTRFEYLHIAAAMVAIAVVWSNVFNATGERLFGLAALAFCGFPLIKHALVALFNRRMTMELSMAIALFAALALGEVLTALVIVLFVLVAEHLEKRTVQSARRSISKLLSILPQIALVKRNEEYIEVPLTEVVKGELVLIKPGSRVVVDGVVNAGSSFIDESAITGESMPSEKLPGAVVYAGTINQTGALVVVAERIGDDTTYGRIIHAVEDSEKSRADVLKLSDRVAGYIVFFALGAAGLTFLLSGNLHDTISVILVAGACGIAAGNPLAVLGSIAFAARLGSIVKGGIHMERLSYVDTIVFDKTGTLTYGTPDVIAVLPAEGETVESLMQTAATAEKVSEHPLAKAILGYASKLGLIPGGIEEFEYCPGRGIVCHTEAGQTITVGNQALMQEHAITGVPLDPAPGEVSEVLVACDGKLVGRIHIADKIRPESRQVVQDLHAMGIKTVMLTGDAAAVANAVAAQVGIQHVAAELRPEEKCQYVRRLKELKRRVAVVGDGINDAPALMEADVGIAVGSGTAIALESADIVLISNNLTRLVDTVRTARRCRRVIYFNLVGTIVIDGVGMLCAGLGLMNPLVAALVHVGSELAFILNSARLFPIFGADRKKKS